MARPLRIEFEGAVYHVTSRGNERKNIFFAKRDYEKFLEYVAQAQGRYGFNLHCYVLMSNHYHLLIETPDKNLSKIMHHINGAYSVYTNTKRKRSGHLFQGRFKAIVVDKDSHLVEVTRYMHLNPVRAKMVVRPEDHPYSSYKTYISNIGERLVTTSCVLRMFSKNAPQARVQYKSFVESALGQELDSPFNAVYGGVILGNEDFVADTLARIEEAKLVKEEVSYRRELHVSSSVDIILGVVGDYYGVTVDEVLRKGKKGLRKVCVYLLKKYSLVSNREIADLIGNTSYTAAAKIYERFVMELRESEELKRQVSELEANLSFVKG